MLPLHMLLRFKELAHSLYQYLFLLLHLELSLLINSVNQIPFFLFEPATKSKSKLKLIRSPVDITQGALLVVSVVSLFAPDWSLDWELPVAMTGNIYCERRVIFLVFRVP